MVGGAGWSPPIVWQRIASFRHVAGRHGSRLFACAPKRGRALGRDTRFGVILAERSHREVQRAEIWNGPGSAVHHSREARSRCTASGTREPSAGWLSRLFSGRPQQCPKAGFDSDHKGTAKPLRTKGLIAIVPAARCRGWGRRDIGTVSAWEGRSSNWEARKRSTRSQPIGPRRSPFWPNEANTREARSIRRDDRRG